MVCGMDIVGTGWEPWLGYALRLCPEEDARRGCISTTVALLSPWALLHMPSFSRDHSHETIPQASAAPSSTWTATR